ncbi:MAG: hypothetical protein ACI352_07060 [Elusimicrobiaceae bacterium]
MNKKGSLLDKQSLVLIILTIFGLFLFSLIENCMLQTKIKARKAAYEAELKAQGLLPQREPRRPKRDIYIPVDRTGQQGRADSTEMFLKSAERTFGAKHDNGLEIVDYGSQVNDYQQRVNAIKKAEAEKLAQRQAQQEAMDIRTGRASSSGRNTNASAVNRENGTKINRLKTSSLKPSFSKR